MTITVTSRNLARDRKPRPLTSHAGSVTPSRTAALLAWASLLLPSARCAAQTLVQLSDLDPNNHLGPRLTSSVVAAKLSGNPLFADLGSKITLIDAVSPSPVAYEFASDGMWNRVLYGQKDVYIRAFKDSSSSTMVLASPGGLDIDPMHTLFVADRMNSRVVLARFDPAGRTLSQFAVTNQASVIDNVVDVAWDGQSAPLATEYFYALDVTSVVSYWSVNSPHPTLLWSYGAFGAGQGQFNAPKGICVGHALGSDGGSVFTNNFYVADAGNRRVAWLQRTSNGAQWMGGAVLPDSGMPSDCTVDHFGNVYVTDAKNSRVVKYTWNLTYLDRYGAYGLGASNNNTFAHPHAIHAPFGTKKNGSNQTIWYGEGRILTAEDWGSQSGAREHYLGIDTWMGTPQTSIYGATLLYGVTDHAYHTVEVLDWNGFHTRTLEPSGLTPPGNEALYWAGTQDVGSPAPQGYYHFQIHVVSGYGCGGQIWCDRTLTSDAFLFPDCDPPSCPQGPNPGASTLSDDAEPTSVFLHQRVLAQAQPLMRVQGTMPGAPVPNPSTTGSLTGAVRQFGIRGLAFGVTRAASAAPVTVRVYSLSGRLVRVLVNERLVAGTYEIGWDGLDDKGRAAAPGVYVALMTIGSARLTQRLILRQSQ